MAWIILLLAGLLEVVWATSMKASDGFTRLWPSVLTVTTMIGSFALLSIAVRTLPLGTSYMIWSGIGALGAFLTGIWLYAEDFTPMRILAALLILAGIAMMKLGS